MANFVDSRGFQIPEDWNLVYKAGYGQGWHDALRLPQVQAGEIALDQVLLRQRLEELQKALSSPSPAAEEDYRQMGEAELWRRATTRSHGLREERNQATEELTRRLGEANFARLYREKAMTGGK